MTLKSEKRAQCNLDGVKWQAFQKKCLTTGGFASDLYLHPKFNRQLIVLTLPTSLTSFVVDSWEIITTSTGS